MTSILRFIFTVVVAHIVSVSSSAQNINPDVVKVANFAIIEHNRMSSYAYALKVVDILSDSAQIVPPLGVKYSIEVRVAPTTCRNNGSVNLEDCSVMANAQMMICNFVVMAVPGENTLPKHLLSQQCA
ncbi:cystatin-1 [Trichomycterus rosablanca]|uniref:cystatin-1 n=1 Tax=Trichomycterus rosablanca TaxID=2290929 RepID=UPI002F360FCE